ncbi:hypothetical protein AXG93_3810s1020 [Marchantia polymorpha subsp. ruderalis]|uniref:Uncharacterized protein n=1 Tax=Marchantia polymorpha subsp. ruderalis TaxID=1480154 RepID=A0A176VDM0_MARPO|nr:hypothetical protein AXG93_3810s1020 [Marchantia polymorpha subsp. ruderalis]
MGLLTREEEKRFSREREILTAEYNEGTEDDNSRPRIPQQTTTRASVKVDVLPYREKPERRLAKRRKVVTDDKEDLILGVRRAEMEVDGIRQLRIRARPKRKASQGLVVTEVSDCRVEKTVAPIVDPLEVATSESTQPAMAEGPSEVLVEVSVDVIVEPSKEGTEMVSPNSLSSKRTRSVGNEEVSQPKTSEELAKELTLSEEILEQDSVVFLLKYLDRKREKYVVYKEVEDDTGFAREIGEIHIVQRLKRLVKTVERREKKYVEELAEVEDRRAEEVRIAEELRRKIAEAKTAKENLCSKIAAIEGKCDMKFRRAEELSASLPEGIQKHEEELTNWAKKLTDCESAKSLEVESECRRLREQLGKTDMRSQEWRRRMEKSKEAYRHLRDETTNDLRLRVVKCLRGFAMWVLQTVKWLKLDSLERRLMSTKANGSARQQQIVKIVKTFSEGFDHARQNVELEIINVLRRLGAEISLDNAITAIRTAQPLRPIRLRRLRFQSCHCE